MTTVDYYELLGVARNAEAATIKTAYRKLLKQVHPDTGGNSGMFRMIQLAYETLSDAGRRAAYDLGMPDPGPGDQPPGPGSGRDAPHRDTRPGAATGAPAPGTPNPDRANAAALDPAQVRWIRSVQDRADRGTLPAETVTPGDLNWVRRSRWLTWALVWALGALTGYLVLDAGPVRPGDQVLLLLVVVVCATVWHRLWVGAAVVTLVATIAGVVHPGHAGAGVAFAWWLWLVAVLVAGARDAAAAVLGDEVCDQILPGAKVAEYSLFGTPGSAVPNADPQTAAAARVGADATTLLTFIPGVRVLHRIRATPSAAKAGTGLEVTGFADQVVVCDDKVALIACRAGVPGTFSWSSYTESLLLNGAHLAAGDVLADLPAAAFAGATRNCQVRTWVVVVSPTGHVVCDNTNAPARVRVGTATEVVNDIGVWFLEGLTARVDRRTLAGLAQGAM